MTRARQNANVTAAVGRNMVINSAMNVAQRSASVTGIGANYGGYFTVDRWRIYAENGAGRLTMTQTADGPNGISANCIKLDCTTADASIAAGEILLLKQTFEGQNLQRIGSGVAGAKQITVSFYVKANAGFTFGCELDNHDNSRQITKLFDTTTDWVRHEITFPADVDDGSSPMDDDNAQSLSLNFWLHVGSEFGGGTLNTASFANYTTANRAAGIDSFFSNTANNFFITGVQMEVGPVATEFEQEDVSLTLQKCQRYFCKIAGTSGAAYQRFGRGHITTTQNANVTAFLPQNLRIFPAVGSTGTASNYTVHHGSGVTVLSAVPSLDGGSDDFANNFTTNAVNFLLTTANNTLTVGQGCALNGNGSAAAFISFDAEL